MIQNSELIDTCLECDRDRLSRSCCRYVDPAPGALLRPLRCVSTLPTTDGYGRW